VRGEGKGEGREEKGDGRTPSASTWKPRVAATSRMVAQRSWRRRAPTKVPERAAPHAAAVLKSCNRMDFAAGPLRSFF